LRAARGAVQAAVTADDARLERLLVHGMQPALS
jgi:hypothetical protein